MERQYVPFLVLPATPLLLQPVYGWSLRAHWCLLFSILFTKTLEFFPAKLFSVQKNLFPSLHWTCAREYSFIDAGVCTCLFWISWGSPQSISLACSSLSEWQPCLPAYQPLSCFPFNVIYKLDEGACHPSDQVLNEDIQQSWHQYKSLWDSTSKRPSLGLCSADHNCLSPAIQSIFYSLYCALNLSVFHRVGCTDTMEDNVNNVHCFQLIHSSCLHRTESGWLGTVSLSQFMLFSVTFSSCMCSEITQSFQENLLHNLPRDWSEATWLPVRWILIVLLEDTRDIGFFSSH